MRFTSSICTAIPRRKKPFQHWRSGPECFRHPAGRAIGIFVKLPPDARRREGEGAGDGSPLPSLGAQRQRKYDWLSQHHVENSRWDEARTDVAALSFHPAGHKAAQRIRRRLEGYGHDAGEQRRNSYGARFSKHLLEQGASGTERQKFCCPFCRNCPRGVCPRP